MARSKEPAEALDYKRKVGERLRDWREALDQSQTVFGARFGLSRDRYAKYELGESEMPYWVLARLDLAGYDIRFLVTGREAASNTGHARPRFKPTGTD